MSDIIKTEVNLHNTTDAQIWAEQFCKIFPNSGLDEGTMIGWFANAMMAKADAMPSPAEQMIRALLGRIETAEAQAREAVMQSLAHLGQAEEAWAAQKAAEAQIAEARREGWNAAIEAAAIELESNWGHKCTPEMLDAIRALIDAEAPAQPKPDAVQKCEHVWVEASDMPYHYCEKCNHTCPHDYMEMVRARPGRDRDD